MESDITILMIVHDTWSYLFHNRKHVFAEFLAKQEWVREVIFCEPPLPAWVLTPEGKKRVQDLDPVWCGGTKQRCERLYTGKLVVGGVLLEVNPKLFVYTTLGIGPPDLNFPMGKCYGMGDPERMIHGLKVLMKERGTSSALLWMHSPFVAGMLTEIPHQWTVYDCTDDFSRFTWLSGEQADEVRLIDEKITEEADLVLTVSQQLQDDKSNYLSHVSPHVVRLPNGCDFEHFAQAAQSELPVPDDVGMISGPILGYFGRGGSQFKLDYPLILFLAARHPEWNFLFIGPYRPNQKELLLPNLHFLGQRPYSELPAYAMRFDVCLLPHSVNALTQSMDPIKLYEYLATGKPVVSTQVAGAADLAEFISVVDSWSKFEDAVEASLKEPRPEQRLVRMEHARSLSWNHRCSALADYLSQYCFSGQSGSEEIRTGNALAK